MPSDTNLRVSMRLEDKMSPGLNKISKNAKNLQIQFEKTAKAANTMAKALQQETKAQKELEKAQKGAEKVADMAGAAGGSGLIGGLAAAAKVVKTVVEETKQSVQDLASVYYLMSKIGNKAIDLTSKLTDTSDSIKLQKARLSAYNTSGFSDDVMYNVIGKSALASRSSLNATSDLVNRMLATGVYSGANAIPQSAKFAEAVNKSLILGGANAKETQSVLLQLSQALSQGTLQGQELKAIRQYAPRMGEYLAEGLNMQGIFDKDVTFGDLKELGSQGELTAERITKAFELMSDKINEDFAAMPWTVEQVKESITTMFDMMMSNLTSNGAGMKSFYKSVTDIMDWLQSEDSIQFWETLSTIVDGFFGIMSVGVNAAADGIEWLSENFDDLAGAAMEILPFIATGFIIAHGKALLLGIAISSAIDYFKNLHKESGETLSDIVQKSVTAIARVIQFAIAVGQTLVGAFITLGSIASGILGGIAKMLGGILSALSKVFGGFADLGDKFSDADLPFLGTEAQREDIKNLGSKGARGISDKLAAAADSVNSVANTFIGYAKAGDATLADMEEKYKQFDPEKIGAAAGDMASTVLNTLDNAGGVSDWIAAANDAATQTAGAGSGVPVEDGAVASKIKGGKLDSSGEVQLSDEDIALLKDIAARDFLINVATSTPTMTNNFGDIKETVDVDMIMNRLSQMLEEEVATSVVMG